jgi:hypothetical protein
LSIGEILEHCRTVHELEKRMKCGICPFAADLKQEMEEHFTSKHKTFTPTILRAYQVPYYSNRVFLIIPGTTYAYRYRYWIPVPAESVPEVVKLLK